MQVGVDTHKRVHVLVVVDDLALPLGQAIGRWANFINQELYGPPTTLPWGLRIDAAHRIPPYNDMSLYPDSVRFQPLFLYESLANFIGFALIFWIARRYALLVLCLGPFGLNLLAAVLHRYPYGASCRL